VTAKYFYSVLEALDGIGALLQKERHPLDGFILVISKRIRMQECKSDRQARKGGIFTHASLCDVNKILQRVTLNTGIVPR
jgi:hypothetical protein